MDAHENPSATYNVVSSRIGSAAIAVLLLSMGGLLLCGYATQQAGALGALVTIVVSILIGGLGVMMAYSAVRPPVHLSLNEEGARFRVPPIRVFWKDIKEARVSRQGMKTIVELIVCDIDKYLSQLNKSQRKALDYEITAGALRFSLVAPCKLERIRKEIDAYLVALPETATPPVPVEGNETAQGPVAFNARFTAAASLDRLYRFFIRDGVIYAIRIGGQGGEDLVAMQFGLLGWLIARLFRLGTSTPEEIASMDQRHPEDLLGDHKHNFKFTPHEVAEARIHPKSAFQLHGNHIGLMDLVLNNGKKFKFQFEDVRHMQCAVANLPTILGLIVEINVQWDRGTQSFVHAPGNPSKL